MRAPIVAISLILAGCGYEWTPDHPDVSYPVERHAATRLDSPGETSCEIGSLIVNGDFEGQWEDVARAVADHGGTHYFVRTSYGPTELHAHSSSSTFFGTTYTSTRVTASRDVRNVVLVYREDRGDGC